MFKKKQERKQTLKELELDIIDLNGWTPVSREDEDLKDRELKRLKELRKQLKNAH